MIKRKIGKRAKTSKGIKRKGRKTLKRKKITWIKDKRRATKIRIKNKKRIRRKIKIITRRIQQKNGINEIRIKEA